MRFIKKPEFRTPGNQARKRSATTLTRRKATHRHRSQSSIKSESSHRRVNIRSFGACRTRPERNVVGHGELVVQTSRVGKKADTLAYRPTIRQKIDAEDHGFTL
jgi:hypothetical protein